MNFELETIVEPEFVRVTPNGKCKVDEMFDFIDLVRSKVDVVGRTRVLMDCRKFDGSLTEADRFQGGQRIAEVFGGRIKAALLMPASQITKLGELTAVNRGARFLVTDSESEATDWLLAP